MMHGPIPDQIDHRPNAVPSHPLVAALERGLTLCNDIIVVFAAVALVTAGAALLVGLNLAAKNRVWRWLGEL